MIKRVVGTLFAAILVGGAVAAGPALAGAAAVDFTGIVALDNCSGSLVRPPAALDTDPALVMSNGHCVKLMGADEVIVDQASSRTFTLLGGSGDALGTVTADRLVYATMKNTDLSLYWLNSTYAQIQQQFGARALELATAHPVKGTGIQIVSGYWKRTYTCEIDDFVHQLKEGSWTWTDSTRYTPECDVIGGTSGSPIIDTASGKVVGVNNTGNESGGRCTMNNPCEVSPSGEVTVRRGINYGQQTYNIAACIGPGNQITLTVPHCPL